MWAWVILVVMFGAWGTAAWFTGLAAKRKGRSRLLWTTLSVLPLGPIAGPLWLASFPKVGEPASVAQKIGRSLLILALLLSLVGNIIGTLERVNDSLEQERVAEKAKETINYEVSDADTHYKQMNVPEITACLALTMALETMTETAEQQEDGMWLFSTEVEANRFNAINGVLEERECNERTYDHSDLDKALDAITSGQFEDITPLVDNWITSNQPNLEDELADIVLSFNEFSGKAMIFEDSFLVRAYSQNFQMIVDLELNAYASNEINQEDLDEYLYADLVSYVCSTPMLKSVTRQGSSFRFKFRANDQKEVGYVEVGDECQN